MKLERLRLQEQSTVQPPPLKKLRPERPPQMATSSPSASFWQPPPNPLSRKAMPLQPVSSHYPREPPDDLTPFAASSVQPQQPQQQQPQQPLVQPVQPVQPQQPQQQQPVLPQQPVQPQQPQQPWPLQQQRLRPPPMQPQQQQQPLPLQEPPPVQPQQQQQPQQLRPLQQPHLKPRLRFPVHKRCQPVHVTSSPQASTSQASTSTLEQQPQPVVAPKPNYPTIFGDLCIGDFQTTWNKVGEVTVELPPP